VRQAQTPLGVAKRIQNFSYAIREVLAEAQKVEASGRKVFYLNIGDPVAFGFQPPAHLVEAVTRALSGGHHGYGPSAGIPKAREAVAAEYTRRNWPVEPDRVFVTAGTSEGIDLALSALVDEGDEVLLPLPTYPLYTAVLAKLGASPRFYRTDPANAWLPDLDHMGSLVTPKTRALVIIDPNNPTGATYPASTRRGLIDLADRYGLAVLADEVYGDLGYDGPVAPLGSLEPDAPIISFSSLSKAYLAPGWRTGWLAAGRSSRLDEVMAAIRKLADGRLCSVVPMQHAIAPALEGDRSHQVTFRAALKARAQMTADMMCAIPGISCTLPMAGFYAMPQVNLPRGKTDQDYVLSLLRATGVLTVHGSGFGLSPRDGFLRIVFLAALDELHHIYGLMREFSSEYLRRST
jgi:aspartate/methionine/tyrosine aminotransferase